MKIPTRYEDLPVDVLQKVIESRVKYINSIREQSAYADHGAYGQDHDTIRRIQDEIRRINHIIDKKLSGEIQ